MQTLRDLGADIHQLPAALDRNLKLAVGMAAQLGANEARTNHKFKDRSGALSASVGVAGPDGSYSANTLTATVGAGKKYARWVELDTKPHLIKPKYRKALRWAGPNGFVFARVVKHPGTKGTHFLANAVENVALPKLHEELVPQAVELSLAQVGLIAR